MNKGRLRLKVVVFGLLLALLVASVAGAASKDGPTVTLSVTPLTGTDSKAGTLIHEMSHFNVVAGTDDVVYGQSGAMSLASSDPNPAVTVADSHEYFAENSPPRRNIRCEILQEHWHAPESL